MFSPFSQNLPGTSLGVPRTDLRPASTGERPADGRGGLSCGYPRDHGVLQNLVNPNGIRYSVYTYTYTYTYIHIYIYIYDFIFGQGFEWF